MRIKATVCSVLLLLKFSPADAIPEAELTITARTLESVASDWSTVYYSNTTSPPVLIGNDKGAASGGLRAWLIDTNGTLEQTSAQTPGRTAVLTTVYGVGGRDLIVTIASPDSTVRLYDAGTLVLVDGSLKKVLGAWAALCSWSSAKSGEQYVYLFGKGQGVQFLFQSTDDAGFELVEVQTFDTLVEASSCAVSLTTERVYFSGDDNPTIYTFAALESTATPDIDVLGEADGDITGLAVYISLREDYLIVAQTDVVEIFDTAFALLGTLTMTGDDGIEIQGLGVYQASIAVYPAGALAYAIESDAGEGFGMSSFATAFRSLNLTLNTAFDPRRKPCKPVSTITDFCNNSGFQQADGSCACFAGYSGGLCDAFTCHEACSGRGICTGASTCDCEAGWGGLHCGFRVVSAAEEIDAFGGDGDDPAIWIHPTDKTKSKIITTIKSEEGAGLAVFYLNGTTAQIISAGEPDNVDIIYGFQAGNRTVDLAYTACRDDNTLCLFEIASDGTLIDIPGGSQPTKDGYDVYGSCAYRSRQTGIQYIFVNAKTAVYLQYELTWVDGSLQTTLVRNFTGGSGGQVEGCVADEGNGWIFIGEEPKALWRYSAEPNDTSYGFLIDQVNSGHMWADVEGVTLVEGASASQGFVLVSQQGVSAYNVYRRAAPHEYVLTFTIAANEEKGIDAVSNTDGIAAIRANLGEGFPYGIFVTHDDANEIPEGGTSNQASFKIVSLIDILGMELLSEIDPAWDPRAF
ncbi:putative 3-phytase [Seiridium cardinale]|uniref:3-phytase n=1 Tax=Seiridium cardinale TaxID=138064 RepID=A0ABR2Y226_9PEZI